VAPAKTPIGSLEAIGMRGCGEEAKTVSSSPIHHKELVTNFCGAIQLEI
jgi:hypothetical protein